MTSPAHLLMAVWGGAPGVNHLEQYGFEGTAGYSDGNINFRDYVSLLGSTAGRRYNHPYLPPPRVHTTYHQGCSMCQNIISSGSRIGDFPHEFRGN